MPAIKLPHPRTPTIWQIRRNRRVVLAVSIIFFTFFFAWKAFPFLRTFGGIGLHTVFDRDIELKKVDERINVLLLGIGGGSHEGPNLTDTIIFASLDTQAKKITLVSIPRDLWIPELQAKINAAYAYGQESKAGGGLRLTKAVVARILDQPVDYAVRIDFDGFIKAVDILGGLDITVDQALDDYEYPISGKENDLCGRTEEELQALATAASQLEAFPCRYEHIHFDKGPTHMDGETALKFVRSRHAVGSEGSDFARSKRQEKVIAAFRDKFFSLGTLLNPAKLMSLYDIVKDSIDTDIKQNEYDDFIKLARQLENASIQSVVIDFGDEETGRVGLLTNPPVTEEYGYQWVIIPRLGNGNFSEIQRVASCAIEGKRCSQSKIP